MDFTWRCEVAVLSIHDPIMNGLSGRVSNPLSVPAFMNPDDVDQDLFFSKDEIENVALPRDKSR